jgi:hypothetical protein
VVEYNPLKLIPVSIRLGGSVDLASIIGTNASVKIRIKYQ